MDAIYKPVVGNRILTEGSVSYIINDTSNMNPDTVLFTTNVISWDTVRSNWFWMFVTGIVGLITGLIVGISLALIEITPAIRLWLNLK